MASKRFGETLRELRNARGYTQQQAADLLGLKNKSTLGSWEVGKSEPDGYTLLRLCKIYEVMDIYAAFGEGSSASKSAAHEIAEKYDRLDTRSQRVIRELIQHLLELESPCKRRPPNEHHDSD